MLESVPDFYRFLILSGIILTRYFLIAGIAFLIFYILLKKKIAWKKIQKTFPKGSDYRREISYSLVTTLIFAIVAFSLFHPAIKPYTQLYSDFHAMGWGYFIGSFFLTILFHDAYFYWTHRLMHHPKIFTRVHKVHHLSINPSPWAALAFHPLEAIVEAGVIVLMVFLFPLHAWTVFAFILFMFFYNVYGHLGYELYPAWFMRTTPGKWLNTSLAHNQHHHRFEGNYGLYFLWWDRWMGTLRQDYEPSIQTLADRVKL